MNNPLGTCFVQMQQFFKSGSTLPLSYRLGALQALKQSILRHQNDIAQALQQDLNKPSCETYMCETGMVLSEI